ncbi:MAG: UDP-2,3-diacylglucosamine diphosphatase [Prevotellaceae bacterium]|nr:UDP-2,3-diacylglucosamine diphosphatase [Prevotellaceae bacterium]
MASKHTYFLADTHLGLPLYDPAERERRLVRWLDGVKNSAAAIYLLGDIFDFWWEYKYVVPRGYVRFLGKLAELTDGGVELHIFCGNHDLWMRNYLQQECGVQVHREPTAELTIGGKRFVVGHGDRLGKPETIGVAILQRIFGSRTLQRLFSMLHPRWAFGFGYAWSRHSRLGKGISTPYRGDSEWTFRFAQQKVQQAEVDYFVFGHRHIPMVVSIPGSKAQMLILGDWIANATFAEFDGENLELKMVGNS